MAPRPNKKRKLSSSPEFELRKSALSEPLTHNSATWDFEDDYAVKRKKASAKESTRLPVRTTDGRWQQGEAKSNNDEPPSSDLEETSDLETDLETALEKAKNPKDAGPDDSTPEREQIRVAKEDLAKIATAVNQEPEENTEAFRALAKIGRSSIIPIQKLALVTQMAVYKDVIPGYRIRPSEEKTQELLSKDVRSLRAYEQALVMGYQSYIKELARCAMLDPVATKGLPGVAVTCACALVTSVPHFNFRGDLLRILVGKLSRLRVDDDAAKCRRALQTLFLEDEEGNATMEAVSLLSKMMRAQKYRVDEGVLMLFLHLRLLYHYSGRRQEGDENSTRPSKKNRSFRTKRQRKEMKEQKALDKDMALADALVDHEERERMQSEILKVVFATYFRVLKMRIPRLMGPVLEGLSKYAHLINVDFFGDLLEAMRDLIKHSNNDEDINASHGAAGDEDEDEEDSDAAGSRNTSRESLLCTATAFALLEGQDAIKARSDSQLDLPFFQTHLFHTLFPLAMNPDLELNSKSLRLTDPQSPSALIRTRDSKVNLQTTTVLLLRCLTAIMLPTFNIRAVPATRLAAFTKQLMTVSLQIPEKSTRALLVLLGDIAKLQGRKVAALWNTEERLGDGHFRALASTPEASNPFAATVWEGELLKKHFCPDVREGVKMLENAVAGAAAGRS